MQADAAQLKPDTQGADGLARRRERRLPAEMGQHPVRWVSAASLAALLDLSSRAFIRRRAAGLVPRPDLHLGRSPRWKLETVREFLRSGKPVRFRRAV